MRVVVDTSILVRALIKPQGTVGPVLQRLRDGAYTLLYSEPLLEKFRLPGTKFNSLTATSQIWFMVN